MTNKLFKILLISSALLGVLCQDPVESESDILIAPAPDTDPSTDPIPVQEDVPPPEVDDPSLYDLARQSSVPVVDPPEPLSPPACVQTQACKQNFDWDPANCQCACLRVAKCIAGYTWDLKTCSCKKLPCGSTFCPENYTADPKDRCKCKCNESPVEFCGRGRGWDRTTCACAPYCDYRRACPKGQANGRRSCGCKPICTKKCRKNFAADIDQKCQCLCTLPAETCKDGYEWSKKTCSCVRKPCSNVKCPENYTADVNDNCICKCNTQPPQTPGFPRLGSRWDATVCDWVNSCDYIAICDNPDDDWSFGTCSCKPSCKSVVCEANYAADIDQNCECLCTLPKQSCKSGYEWSKKTCSCVAKPCGTTVCPENYTADPKDKCKCKCNESPAVFCGRGRGWDRTTCQCVSMCDFIKTCPKGQKWSLRSCSCKPICTKKCPKNFAADPEKKCQCLCTLPAQTCKKGFEWDKKTCSCTKNCSSVRCKGGNKPDPNQNCACRCPKRIACYEGFEWDKRLCGCVEIDY